MKNVPYFQPGKGKDKKAKKPDKGNPFSKKPAKAMHPKSRA